ncbi:protein LYRIC-like isoform X2 [Hippocampus zosterae]|uniref:protein LYRIC-like isoform X2 n=1 Tax=Hippocampus zosterae TaxID=109293 RepID=UPI00223D6D8F|nr:protein LYRIC-like isoform X2 [Hippocampus zosterae]
MEQWKDAASQQAELLASRVNELLYKSQEFLRAHFGVDLAIKPELIPPWVILVAACTGLVLVLVIWASMCQALFKKRPATNVVEDTVEMKRSAGKPVKSEEPKKRKKRAEKKSQPNGRAVTEEILEEDAIVNEDRVPHQQPPPQSKSEKPVETKKSKKKATQVVKETVTAVGKEPEEGTWETKVSNKEKREQRKKDKSSSDGSASPGGGAGGGGGGGGGGGTPMSATPEQRKASASPANQKKKKGDSSKVTADKMNASVSHVNTSEAPLGAAGVADIQAVKVKIPHTAVPKTQGLWTPTREPAPLWKTDIDDSWTVIDRIPSDLVPFTKMGVGTADPQLVDNASWLSQPKVDDEWSGFNGGSADPSSDWNAPSELWGNYEEPTPCPTPVHEQPRREPARQNLSGAPEEDDEDEKDNGETAADGGAKNKKKRKKKKKVAQEEETGQVEVPEKKLEPASLLKDEKEKKKKKPKQQPSAQEHPAAPVQLERPVKDSTSQKPLAAQVPLKQPEGHSTAHINLPAPTQHQKPEEIQVVKLSKKKKARRET